MKKLLLSLGIALTALSTQAQVVAIPDANFLKALIADSVDTNHDGQIQTSEAQAVANLQVANSSISDLTGIEVFTNMGSLDCSNNNLSTLNLKGQQGLGILNCSGNRLTSLILNGCQSLTNLSCSNNQLTTLDVSFLDQNIFYPLNGLQSLNCSSNPSLTQICIDSSQLSLTKSWVKDATASWNTTNCSMIVNIPDYTFYNNLLNQGVDTNNDYVIEIDEALAVKKLVVSNFGSSNPITDLTGIEAFTNLDTLDCSNNALTKLDLSHNAALTYLDCSGNLFTTLDVSHYTALTFLNCSYNTITTMDISHNTALLDFACLGNQMTMLNVGKNIAMTALECENNKFTTLDVSALISLQYFMCDDNNFAALDVSHNTALTDLRCYNNPSLTQICVNPSMLIDTNYIEKDPTAKFSTACATVYIPDNHLIMALIANGVDTNHDGEIQVSEALAVTRLNVSDSSIASMDGIAAFTNLTYLNVSNNNLDSLDVSQLPKLDSLDCSNNQLVYFYLGKGSTVVLLRTANARMESTGTSSLVWLNASHNQLTSLDVSGDDSLNTLIANANPDLSTICISESQTSKTGAWTKDPAASYSLTCNVMTGTDDTALPAAPKTLVGVYTPLGQPIDPKQATNGLFIYKYSDGSTRKVMSTE